MTTDQLLERIAKARALLSEMHDGTLGANGNMALNTLALTLNEIEDGIKAADAVQAAIARETVSLVDAIYGEVAKQAVGQGRHVTRN